MKILYKKWGITFLLGVFALGGMAVEPKSDVSAKKVKVTRNKQKPNILFIAVDDLRPNLGCYGDRVAITPNIDQLANEGVLFSSAYCQAGSCAPSRTSLLTGLRPDEIGVIDHNTVFRDKVPNVVTLPQLFMQNGYEVINYGKIFHGHARFQDEQSWSQPAKYFPGSKKDQYVLEKNRTGGKTASYESEDVDDDAYIDGVIARDAIGFLQKRKYDDDPFFLAVGFFKPHLPFCAPQRYWDLYKEDILLSSQQKERPTGAPEVAFHAWQELRGYADIPNAGPLTKEMELILRKGYYSCISYTDAQIGKVLNELKRQGLDENTIVVLWGDHGYHLGEQDLWHKHTNYELDVRVPLIIKDPRGNKSGERIQLVELLDIYPTLTDLCDIKSEQRLSGRSLKPLLQKKSDKKWANYAFNQYFRPYKAIGGRMKPEYMGYSVRTDKYRYVGWFKQGQDMPEKEELYDLSEHVVEKQNLAGRDKVKTIQKDLRERTILYKNKSYKEAVK
ncbi:DUF4976 domain-containing protein [Puteibacter caeruleilacunae]|nr:DUF4976 domain-containing protein [Puteibacter caeruleilacunae]